MPSFFSLIHFLTIDLGGINPPGGGPQKHRHPIRGFKTFFQAGIPQGLPGRYQAKQIRPGKPLNFPPAEIIGSGKIAYLGGYLNPEAGGVEKIKRADPGSAGNQVFPEFRPGYARSR